MQTKKLLYGMVLAVVLALGLAACGSSSDDSTGASTSTSEKSTNTSSESGGAAKELTAAEAEAALEAAEVRPTSLSAELPPIGKPVPGGKKIVWVSCGAPNCVEVGQVVSQAGQSLGWQTQVLETDGSPTQLQNAWTQAIREEPYAILFGGTERSLIQRFLGEAEQKGIIVAAAATNEPDGSPAIGEGIDYNTGSNQQVSDAPVYADFVTANTNAEGEAVFVSIQGLPVSEATKEATESEVAAACPKCSLDTLEISLEQIADAPTLIVSYLRSHPDVKTMILPINDVLGTGLPAALKSAGLNDVKITGSGANSTVMQYIESGQQTSSIAPRLVEFSYEMVDYVARRAAGVKPIPAMEPQAWLLTKGNIPDVKGGFPVVENVESQFEQAWGK